MQTPSNTTTGSATLSAEHSREQLQQMSVADLKKLAIQLNIGSGAWRQGQRKETLVESILAGRPVNADGSDPFTPLDPSSDAVAENLQKALAAAIAAATANSKLDEARVVELIEEHAPRVEPRTIRFQMDDRAPIEVDRQHFKFPLLLACCKARVPVFLVGPAGTGKTSTLKAIGQILELPADAMSIGPMTSKSDLFGMRDANGTYHESPMVRLAKNGGVFGWDEFDAGHAGVLTQINMLVANRVFNAPDGTHAVSENFIPVFLLNTYGNGADRQYVGRQQLDAATKDRGAFIDWPTDEGLEASFVGVNQASPSFDLAAGGIPSVEQWLAEVRRFRRAVESLSLRHVVSPRAVIYGSQLISAKVGLDHLKDILLWKGMEKDSRAKVEAALRTY